jgi:hypothetical protein
VWSRVGEILLVGFELKRGGFGGEGFAEAATGFVAPVGVVFADFSYIAGVLGIEC